MSSNHDDMDEDENEDEKSVRNSLEDPYHIPIDTQLHVSSSRQDDRLFIDDENHSQGDPPPVNYCMMVLDEDEDGNETRCNEPCGPRDQICHHCLMMNNRSYFAH